MLNSFFCSDGALSFGPGAGAQVVGDTAGGTLASRVLGEVQSDEEDAQPPSPTPATATAAGQDVNPDHLIENEEFDEFSAQDAEILLQALEQAERDAAAEKLMDAAIQDEAPWTSTLSTQPVPQPVTTTLNYRADMLKIIQQVPAEGPTVPNGQNDDEPRGIGRRSLRKGKCSEASDTLQSSKHPSDEYFAEAAEEVPFRPKTQLVAFQSRDVVKGEEKFRQFVSDLTQGAEAESPTAEPVPTTARVSASGRTLVIKRPVAPSGTAGPPPNEMPSRKMAERRSLGDAEAGDDESSSAEDEQDEDYFDSDFELLPEELEDEEIDETIGTAKRQRRETGEQFPKVGAKMPRS